MRRITAVVLFFLLFACSQAFASNDIRQLFENYFKGTAADSPLYNFSAIFFNVNKISGRTALEKKIEESVFVLMEQEQSLEIMYLAVPLSYEESNFSKTLNLTYKNKNEIITVRYELLKTY